MAGSQLGHRIRPTRWGKWPFAVMLSAALTSDALAQTAPPAEIGKWDAAFVGGYLGVRPEIDLSDRYADRWYAAGQVGVTAGRYFTPHLKAEVELSTSSEGRQLLNQQLTIPGATYPVFFYTERFGRLREISGAVVYQFSDNQWVHPFVVLGVAAAFDQVRSYTPRQTLGFDPRIPAPVITPEIREGPETTTSARLLVGGGAKMYFTRRAFVRTDGRIGAGNSGSHVALRIGLGVDF